MSKTRIIKTPTILFVVSSTATKDALSFICIRELDKNSSTDSSSSNIFMDLNVV